MKSLRDILQMVEPKMGIPGMTNDYDEWGRDIKNYAEVVWPDLTVWALIKVATNLYLDLSHCSPIEQKMFLALQRKYIGYLTNYPDTTAILIREKLSNISQFLISHGQKSIFQSGDIDFEIDLFLYLDCFLIDGPNGKRLRMPFYVCIECDSHDFHERTKKQAKKDKSKDRILKIKGLDVVRFTGSEITREPDKCVEEIDNLVKSYYKKLEEILAKRT